MFIVHYCVVCTYWEMMQEQNVNQAAALQN